MTTPALRERAQQFRSAANASHTSARAAEAAAVETLADAVTATYPAARFAIMELVDFDNGDFLVLSDVVDETGQSAHTHRRRDAEEHVTKVGLHGTGVSAAELFAWIRVDPDEDHTPIAIDVVERRVIAEGEPRSPLL